ncbi:putative metalloprotease CJM1_0395 family protein [Sedimenticola sp.]|uniref:putative metalloprotease CJM1_0395 family protein n=1 Tax=Sedimenticola sp. TaxID=1940285 RepID=UPI003D14F08A
MEIQATQNSYRYPPPSRQAVDKGEHAVENRSTEQSPSAEDNKPATEQVSQTTEYDSAEYQALRALQARDREVRAHEQAHLSAAGRFAISGANFTYQRGPDGQLYAVGGDVQIDLSPVPGDPQATEQKAEAIRRAALAPSDPSPQDRKVAAQAGRLADAARAEIQRVEAQSTGSSDDDNGAARLARRLANSGAVTLQSETIEQLDLLI